MTKSENLKKVDPEIRIVEVESSVKKFKKVEPEILNQNPQEESRNKSFEKFIERMDSLAIKAKQMEDRAKNIRDRATNIDDDVKKINNEIKKMEALVSCF